MSKPEISQEAQNLLNRVLKVEAKFNFTLGKLVEILCEKDAEKIQHVLSYVNGELNKTFELRGQVEYTEYNLKEESTQ